MCLYGKVVLVIWWVCVMTNDRRKDITDHFPGYALILRNRHGNVTKLCNVYCSHIRASIVKTRQDTNLPEIEEWNTFVFEFCCEIGKEYKLKLPAPASVTQDVDCSSRWVLCVVSYVLLNHLILCFSKYGFATGKNVENTNAFSSSTWWYVHL